MTLAQEDVTQAKHHKVHYVDKKKGHLKEVAALKKNFADKENKVEVKTSQKLWLNTNKWGEWGGGGGFCPTLRSRKPIDETSSVWY